MNDLPTRLDAERQSPQTPSGMFRQYFSPSYSGCFVTPGPSSCSTFSGSANTVSSRQDTLEATRFSSPTNLHQYGLGRSPARYIIGVQQQQLSVAPLTLPSLSAMFNRPPAPQSTLFPEINFAIPSQQKSTDLGFGEPGTCVSTAGAQPDFEHTQAQISLKATRAALSSVCW